MQMKEDRQFDACSWIKFFNNNINNNRGNIQNLIFILIRIFLFRYPLTYTSINRETMKRLWTTDAHRGIA